MKLKLNHSGRYKHKWGVESHPHYNDGFMHWELYTPDAVEEDGDIKLRDQENQFTFFRNGERLYQGPPR